MPVNVPRDLPARAILEAERIFVMSDERAGHQDIRPMRIAILNLMPLKVSTETQLLRLLSNNPLQIEITLLHMASHVSRTTSAEHLESFYSTFDDVAHMHFDGLIVTGAPIEKLDFEDVDYWPEMTRSSTGPAAPCSRPCTSAGVRRRPCTTTTASANTKSHRRSPVCFPTGSPGCNLRSSPGSTTSSWPALTAHRRSRRRHRGTGEVDVLAVSDEAGVYLAATPDGRQVFVTGHPEYDADTLAREYRRDSAQGLPIAAPARTTSPRRRSHREPA